MSLENTLQEQAENLTRNNDEIAQLAQNLIDLQGLRLFIPQRQMKFMIAKIQKKVNRLKLIMLLQHIDVMLLILRSWNG